MKRQYTNLPFGLKITLLGILIIIGKLNQQSQRVSPQLTHNQISTDTLRYSTENYYQIFFKKANWEKNFTNHP